MNTIFRIPLTMIIIVGMLSCKNESKNENHSKPDTETATTTTLRFSDEKMEKQFQHYLYLKTALVNAEVNEAQSGAQMLMKNTGDADLNRLLSHLSKSDDLETVRSLFSDVTDKMSIIVGKYIV